MEVLHWISVRYNNALYSMNTEFVIMVKILLDAKFSGIPLIESFLHERLHSEIVS